jgi:hypothetical protein
MSTFIWSLTPSDLEQEGIAAMTTTVGALVEEGFLKEKEMEEWVCTHTMVLRKPSWFSRTFKPSEKEKHIWRVAKIIGGVHAIE